jgi:hypothetical protein
LENALAVQAGFKLISISMLVKFQCFMKPSISKLEIIVISYQITIHVHLTYGDDPFCAPLNS